ncbi:MAG: alpha/beta hydrolase [Cyanobacteria bacterium J06621_3]
MKAYPKLNWRTRLLDKLLRLSKPLEQMNRDEIKNASEQQLPALVEQMFAGKKLPIYEVREQAVPGRHGDIPIRLYYPTGQDERPLLAFFHGGGWVYGNFQTHDRTCRRISNDANMVVLAVRYRLAPFYKFPTALEDCYDALSWVVDHASELNINAESVSVSGDSAGGNLAASVCLMARQQKSLPIERQILLYPVLSGELEQPSVEANAEAPVLTKERMQCFVDYYANEVSDVQQPYFSPLLAQDLSGLPPALIITAEYDPLHDQAVSYARRLKVSGVQVKLIDYAGTIHGFISFPPFCKEALLAHSEIANYLSIPQS